MSAEKRDASESVESDRTGEGKAEEAQDAMSGYASADLLDSEVSEKPQNSSTLDESFQAIPALKAPRSWKEIETLVAEERARHLSKEGL